MRATAAGSLALRLRAAAVQRPWLRPALRCGQWVLRQARLRPPAVSGGPDREAYARWIATHDRLTEADRAAIRAHVGRLAHRPLISVVMAAYETPEELLRQAIGSVQAQLYPNWELCVADDASPSPHVAALLAQAAEADPRIRWVRRERNGHIAAATNSALALARGEFVALMDHDDLLPEHALYHIAVELEAHPEADLVYSDEDKIDAAGGRFDPYFKPGWSPELMLGQNLVSHLGVYRRSLLERLGGLREGMEGSQDYDLALRVARSTAPGRIRHVPAVLYHWRQPERHSSFSQTQLDRCLLAARQAVAEHVAAGGVVGVEVLPLPTAPFWNRVRWPLPQPAPPVSLILDGEPEALRRHLAGLPGRTDYPALEIVIAHRGSPPVPAGGSVRLVEVGQPGNRSALRNAAVRAAVGEVIVLLDGGIEPIDANWLREMVPLALHPDVGAVGAKLLGEDGAVREAGLVLGAAVPLGRSARREDIGYFGSLGLTREVSAASGACLAIRRDVYEAVGGLDADGMPEACADIDLCLRLWSRGLRVLWTPFAELRQRGPAAAAADWGALRSRWGEALDADRFYNPAFDRRDAAFRLSEAPRRDRPWLAHGG